MTLHKNNEDLKNVWSERYEKAYRLFYGQKEKTERPRLSTKKVDWGSVALSVLKVGIITFNMHAKKTKNLLTERDLLESTRKRFKRHPRRTTTKRRIRREGRT